LQTRALPLGYAASGLMLYYKKEIMSICFTLRGGLRNLKSLTNLNDLNGLKNLRNLNNQKVSRISMVRNSDFHVPWTIGFVAEELP